jgi:hypothetical protein
VNLAAHGGGAGVTGPLYGRRLEPKLVRDLLIRPEGIADGHQDRPPIVVLEGGAATGKTALLSEMAKGWAGKVPCSYLDVEAIEGELGELAVAELLAVTAGIQTSGRSTAWCCWTTSTVTSAGPSFVKSLRCGGFPMASGSNCQIL